MPSNTLIPLMSSKLPSVRPCACACSWTIFFLSRLEIYALPMFGMHPVSMATCLVTSSSFSIRAAANAATCVMLCFRTPSAVRRFSATLITPKAAQIRMVIAVMSRTTLDLTVFIFLHLPIAGIKTVFSSFFGGFAMPLKPVNSDLSQSLQSARAARRQEKTPCRNQTAEGR